MDECLMAVAKTLDCRCGVLPRNELNHLLGLHTHGVGSVES